MAKKIKSFIKIYLVLYVYFLSPQAFSFMPGEPNPNTSPKSDKEVTADLIDDRAPCPEGSKKYQKMICSEQERLPNCDKGVGHHPVLECRKTMPHLSCKEPKKLVHVLQCNAQ